MKFLAPALLSLLLIVFPDGVAAQSGLVPCTGLDCTACHFAEMGNRVLIWLIGVLFAVFAVLIAVAGWGLVTSGGNPSAKSAAKDKFMNAIIGIIIVLAAWILVDTLMRGLLTSTGTGVITGYGFWADVQCQSITDSTVAAINASWFGDPNGGVMRNANVMTTTLCAAAPPGNVNCTAALAACPAGTVGVVDSSNASNHYVNCVDTAGTGPAAFTGTPAAACDSASCAALTVPCKPGANCNASPDLVSRLAAMHAAAGVGGARVTEGYPPTRTHKSQCHYNGTCVDYSQAGGMTAAEVVAVYNAAQANGLRAVYEVSTEARRQELITAGVPAENVKNYGSWISGEHFSVYGY